MKRFPGSNSTATKDREAEIQQILAILHKWGIHTLGQLAALDKEQLAARLGPEAVRMWERANGKSERLLKLVRPPESFDESFEFENEIETTEPLLFMLRRFLEQLTQDGFVRRRNGFAAANKQRYERCFKIPQPTNDVDLLFRMLHTHLENFKSEYPITAVSLDAQPIKAASRQFGLFETTLRNPNQLLETLTRLTALLGADRVGTPVLEETHRPDAFRMEPFSWSFEDNPSSSPSPPNGEKGSPLPEGEDGGEGHRRLRTTSKLKVALRRFRPAVSASVFLSENVPAHVRSVNISSKVAERRGPYLASGNWWDETAWACAEWDLQLENGDLIRAHEAEGTWKIDGIYD